jgi:CheY-like chemotaxis protein
LTKDHEYLGAVPKTVESNRSMVEQGLPSGKRKRRVVIIDDEPAFAKLFAKMVSDLGYDVMVSTDARSSYTYELRPSDIAFVDIQMPNVDGLQVLALLAGQNTRCSIVVMSGHGERLDEAEKLAKELDLQLIGALEKPFRLAEVIEVLKGA